MWIRYLPMVRSQLIFSLLVAHNMVIQILRIESNTSHDSRYHFNEFCCSILENKNNNIELTILEDIRKIILEDLENDEEMEEEYTKVRNLDEDNIKTYFTKISEIFKDNCKFKNRIGTNNYNYKQLYKDEIISNDKFGLIYYCDVMVHFDGGYHYTYIINVARS